MARHSPWMTPPNWPTASRWKCNEPPREVVAPMGRRKEEKEKEQRKKQQHRLSTAADGCSIDLMGRPCQAKPNQPLIRAMDTMIAIAFVYLVLTTNPTASFLEARCFSTKNGRLSFVTICWYPSKVLQIIESPNCKFQHSRFVSDHQLIN